MKSAKALEMLTIIEYDASMDSNCWPRPDGGWTSKPGPTSAAQLALHCPASVDAFLHRDIDAIERSPASEHVLCGVDVHDRDVAAEGTREARGLDDAANGEGLLAVRRPERKPAADRNAVAVGEFLGEDQRIGLREEDQRVVNGRIAPAFEVVVAQAAVARHVHAKDEQVALAGDVRVDDDFDDRHGDPYCGRRLHDVQHVLAKARFAGRDLELGLTGDPVDGLREPEEHRLIRRVHPDEHRDAQDDAGRREDGPQDVLAEVGPGDETKQDHGAARGIRPGCVVSRVVDDVPVTESDRALAALAPPALSWVTITTVEPMRECRS